MALLHTLFLIIFARRAKFTVDKVSPKHFALGCTLATRNVLALPPSESCSYVNMQKINTYMYTCITQSYIVKQFIGCNVYTQTTTSILLQFYLKKTGCSDCPHLLVAGETLVSILVMPR